eukprot:368053_1
MMSIIGFIFIYLIQNAHCEDTSTSVLGSYQAVDDLEPIDTQLRDITTELYSFLDSVGVYCDRSDAFEIVYAEAQVVAGTNYKVTLNIGTHRGVIIQYFIALPTDNETSNPQDLQLLDDGLIVGEFKDMDEDGLDPVRLDVETLRPEIISKMKYYGAQIHEKATIDVMSAQKMVGYQPGIEYWVTMNVGGYTNVVILYLVDDPWPWPVDGEDLTPQQFKLTSFNPNERSVQSANGMKDDEHNDVVIVVVCIALGLCVLLCAAAVWVYWRKSQMKASKNLYTKLSSNGVVKQTKLDVNL